ncbi:ArgP/LysG family DNA-binding transcriptional regulator [Micrococcus sp.]|uniref:ArgP/LysG family DNA-binding transcriptional regulator n=1 Tax=Micrococcus sp. TaxID=1271 RepID=UPI0026DCE231|nr:ArgP/LysG family DNA-binding transcriptional regulator [Micrococcus sp.]MDO4239139.1 ArgP/LysG family DNA-binding transcriptional regulator [Micrococcus sp.]
MNSDHLRALVAAVDHGTFDAGAEALRISGSAFSQRVKALERQTGQVLLTRTVPVRPTPAGERMLRLARQTLALEDEALTALGRGAGGRTPLSVAVNADSLDTWWRPVLREAATWDDVVLHLHAEDQGHTTGLLRDGTAVAAVTDDPAPVTGCTAERIGTMRYHAVATAFLLDLHRDAAGRIDVGTLPVVDYGPRDGLQRAVLARAGAEEERARTGRPAPPHHQVPSVAAYATAVRVGLGWGMLPTEQVPAAVFAGTHPDLTLVPELGDAEIPLHWQRWSAGPAALDRLTETVRRWAPRA